MQQQDTQKLLVVMLDDMVNHSVPRILSIRKHLDKGEVLTDADIHFLSSILKRLDLCYGTFEKDTECKVIFSTIGHMLFKVIKIGLKNEKIKMKNFSVPSKLKQADFQHAIA
jgi:hypothetical protein